MKSVDHDKMPHYAAFHLGLHGLPKYPQNAVSDQTGSPLFAYTEGSIKI